MPIGPHGEKRPADTLHVAKLLTGEAEEELRRRGAAGERYRKGGVARAAALSPEQRREIARKGVAARKAVDDAPSIVASVMGAAASGGVARRVPLCWSPWRR